MARLNSISCFQSEVLPVVLFKPDADHQQAETGFPPSIPWQETNFFNLIMYSLCGAPWRPYLSPTFINSFHIKFGTKAISALQV
jgi:hypothetical protein